MAEIAPSAPIEAAMPAPRVPQLFTSPYAIFDALQFDGTRESALALAQAFPDRVARPVEHEAVLLVLALNACDREGLHVMEPGSWLVRDRWCYGPPKMLTDQHFRCLFTPSPVTA